MSDFVTVATEPYRPMGIYRKVVELRKRIGAIRKDQRGQGVSYTFRGYEALFSAARPAMDELGVVLETKFEATDGVSPTYTTAKGGTGTQCAGLLRVWLIDADDGSRVEYQSPVVALDTSDKAAGKALSYGMKTALFAGLLIPTEDLPEHDASRPEVPTRAKSDPVLLAKMVRTKVNAADDKTAKLNELLAKVAEREGQDMADVVMAEIQKAGL